MGTRHLICVVVNNVIKVAQYGQWDGYPSGQGAAIESFLVSSDLKRFKEKVEALDVASEEDVKKSWESVGAYGELVSMAQSQEHSKHFPQFSRDTGADILKWITKSKKGSKVSLQTDFAADSLFCEYAYVIDMDKEVLEVYKGFNKKPLGKTQRFQKLTKLARGGYHPVKLWKKIKFSKLDGNTVASLAEKEEE